MDDRERVIRRPNLHADTTSVDGEVKGEELAAVLLGHHKADDLLDRCSGIERRRTPPSVAERALTWLSS